MYGDFFPQQELMLNNYRQQIPIPELVREPDPLSRVLH